MKYDLVLMALVGILIAGCVQQQMHLCSDKETIVYSLDQCPPFDEEYEECMDMPLESEYYYDESPRDKCFYNLAVKRENTSLCNKILAEYYYSDYSPAKCGARIALLTDSLDECEELRGAATRNDCYSEYAMMTDDPSVCDSLPSGNARDECLSQFIGWLSVPPSWDICEKFSKAGYRDECYYYAAEDTADLSYCEKMSGSSYAYEKSSCYANVAMEYMDASICGELADTDDRNSCYFEYAYDTDEPYVCDNVESVSERDECLYQFISGWYGGSDWSFCDTFNKTSYRDECYYDAADDTLDTSYCDKISGDSYYYDKASCYGNIADWSGNPMICSELTTTREKDDCYYYYATTYPYRPEACNNIVDESLREMCEEEASDSYWW